MKYRDYLQTEHWKEVRKEAILFAEGRCQICNAKNVMLNVHHRSYKVLWREKPSDVIVLCRECHSIYHHKLILKDLDYPKAIGRAIAKTFENIALEADDIIKHLIQKMRIEYFLGQLLFLEQQQMNYPNAKDYDWEQFCVESELYFIIQNKYPILTDKDYYKKLILGTISGKNSFT